MNKKYLFGMLVSGAMLAACTADDLNVAPVAQNVNPSAPVFTVTFGDDDVQNRAMYDDGNNYHALRWVEYDKMSLFHGIQSVSISSNVGELQSWQNAVYEAKKNEDGEASLEFYTAAMVQPGKAVMVYPADIDFRNPTSGNLGQNSPIVKINKVQGAADRDSLPYISEVIDITVDGKKQGSSTANTAGVAGYNKTYEIAMKQAAGILRLVLNKINPVAITDPDVAALKVKSVTIDLGEEQTRRTALGNSRPFSLELPVVATEEIDASTDFGKAHPTWRYRTSLNTAASLADPTGTNDKTSWSLKTTGVYESTGATDTVFFNILPNSSAGSKVIKGGDLIVETNYGYVTIHNSAELFGSKEDKAFMDVLESVMAGLWYKTHPDGKTTSKWDGEYRGGYVGTRVTVDLDSLNMDGMHIQTDKELKDAIKVYETLYAEKTGTDRDVKFYLDGNASNTFEMTAATLALVEEQMVDTKTTGHGLKFEACGEAHPKACTKVKIQSGATATEVPSTLIFENTSGVEVQLAGDWTFYSVTKVATDNTDKSKLMKNVNQLTVLGTLDLKNNVKVKSSEASGTVLANGIVVATTGSVNVTGQVYLMNDLTNYGTIEIKKEKNGLYNVNELLLAENGVKLTNMEPTVYNAKGQDITTGWDEGAVINNGGTLGTLRGTTGAEILNYGVIYVDGVDASTEVTENGDTGTSASVNNEFKHNQSTATANNRMGSIVLNDPKASKEKTVVTGNQKGFIKITITKSQAEAADYGQVANYAIIAAGCEEVYVGSQTVGTATKNYMPSNILYIEVANTTQEVRFEGMETATSTPNNKQYTEFALNGLFVKSGAFLVIPEITTVKLDAASGTAAGKVFNAGRIDAKGTLDFADGNGYYGASTGQIVTGK